MRDEVFIPIDYDVDYHSLLLAVTWAILMKGGLAILAKFKIFSDGADDKLPSWVIDWRLAAGLFHRVSRDFFLTGMPSVGEEWNFTLQNAWHVGNLRGVQPAFRSHLKPHPPPLAHQHFCNENSGKTVSFTKLRLHGVVDTRFRIEGNYVLFKRSICDRVKSHILKVDLSTDIKWHLDCDVQTTDVVV